MHKAAGLVRAFVQAGYTKIHLDCSMPLGGEEHLSLEKIARRTAELAEAAEQEASNGSLRYVIGSEVPAAGGARAGEAHPAVTTPESAAQTLEAARQAFQARGLHTAWERVRALVVQPGVEFGDAAIHDYDRAAAAPLSRFIETVPGIVYEAHSTDYQTPAALRALVQDHFAILKVGPALTFALREAVFALAEIEEALKISPASRMRETLEEAMLANPVHWQKHYGGSPEHQKFARAYSFSDRIRYYWNVPAVQAAFERLLRNLEQTPPPLSLLSQYLPQEYEQVRAGRLSAQPCALIMAHVTACLEGYLVAVQ
jgi:D-tagatose-1,6-bisphosphate aldolase subunit GatZ/KbaZ